MEKRVTRGPSVEPSRSNVKGLRTVGRSVTQTGR